MAVKEIVPQAMNSVWGADTPNKLNLNDTEIGSGIIYQSLVVSNQMNAALYKISQAVRAHQCAGGYYTPGQRYFKGMIVMAAVVENTSLPPGIYYYECIKDDGVGIVDTPLYTTVLSTQSLGGVNVYTVNPTSFNSTYWRKVDGHIQSITASITKDVTDLMNQLRAEINQAKTDIQNLGNTLKQELTQQINEQKQWVTEQLSHVTDTWKDLGTINGGTFNLNFAGENDSYNCFSVAFNGAVNFGTVNFTGARERSGCLLITAGAGYINTIFSNAYYSFSVKPFTPTPVGSAGGNKIWMFYKVHPTHGVCFTRG